MKNNMVSKTYIKGLDKIFFLIGYKNYKKRKKIPFNPNFLYIYTILI